MNNTHKYIDDVAHFPESYSVIVWLNKAGQQVLNTSSYEISISRGSVDVEWTDKSFGHQYIGIALENSEDESSIEYILGNPENVIEDIESRLESLREKAASEVTDIKREFIEGSAALTFKVAGEDHLEWLDDEDHNFLINNLGDSHLSINGNFSDEIYDAIVKQLKEWLAENPIDDIEEAA